LPDIEDSLKSLNEKLDWIVHRLSYLEAVLVENQQHPEVVSFLRGLRAGTSMYGEPLKVLSGLLSVSKLLESSGQRDETTRLILNVIAVRGPQNISQLAREIQHQKGKGSRTTVRKRVKELVEDNVLAKQGDKYGLAK
jgi:hypothetical protein